MQINQNSDRCETRCFTEFKLLMFLLDLSIGFYRTAQRLCGNAVTTETFGKIYINQRRQ